MKIIFTVIIVVNICVSKPINLFSQAVDINDSLALVDFYNSTNGDNWSDNSGWLQGPVSTWHGITLTNNNTRVKELYFPGNNLNGEIPLSLGNLTSCDLIYLPNNSLNGSIPFSLGNLISLKELYLYDNQLIGQIPSSLGNLNNLNILYLQGNRLSGQIPISLGNLSSAVYIDLGSNTLSGKISNTLGHLPNLNRITIAHNKFTYDGLERFVQNSIPSISIEYCVQDTVLPIERKNGKLYVSAGGTLQNNTYIWRSSSGGYLEIVGDSTYTPLSADTYYVQVINSIVSQCSLSSDQVFASPILVIDPNPNMITASGSINTNLANIDYNNRVTKAATDGVTKLLLITTSNTPVTFSIDDNSALLSTLTNQLTNSNQVTISPNSSGKVVALYTVPDGYGKENKANKQVEVTATNNMGIIGNVSFELVKPPVVLVHGMWSAPEIWQKGGFIKSLKDANFSNIFLADYSAYAATTFDPESPASLPGRNSVAAAVREGLSFYRSRGIAVTQADLVGHSLGGLMSRSWSQQPDFKNVGNFQQGYIHKLITLGTPHRGSPLGPELVASQYNLIRIPYGDTTPIPLWLVLTLAGMPVGSCHADFAVTSPGVKALTATPPYHTYSIVGNQLGQIGGYLAFSVAALAAFNHSYADIFRAHAPCTDVLEHDLVVPISSQQGYLNTTKTFYATGHSIPAFTTETNSKDIQNKVIDLLLSDSTAEFSAGFPAPSLYPLDCTTANQRPSANSPTQANRQALTTTGNQTIKIISPVSGTIYKQNSGARIKLQFEKVGGAQPSNCVFIVQDVNWFTITDSVTNSTTFTLPDSSAVGNLNIVLLGRDSSGVILGDTLHIIVTAAGNFDSLAVEPNVIQLDSSLRERSVYVHGYYQDSAGRFIDNNLSLSSTGTVYQVKNGNIFTVTKDGLITAKNLGIDTLIITNGAQTIKVPVVVDSNFLYKTLYPSSIDFADVPDKAEGDDPFSLEATSTSGERINFTLISGPVELVNGVVVIKGTGIVTIQATCAGNAYFDSAAPVTKTFNINSVLPLQVLTFAGSLVNNNVMLNWITANEQNTSFFIVQRSIDGIHFTEIGKVNAKANSSSSGNYYFQDKIKNIITGSPVYYRLKEVDKDAKQILTSIISITLAIKKEIILYPNPTRRIINLLFNRQLEGKSYLKLFDMVGREVFHQNLTNRSSQQINIPPINGNYKIIIWNNGVIVHRQSILISN